MKLSTREATLGLATLAAAMFAVLFTMAGPRMTRIGELREKQALVEKETALKRKLVDERGKWEARYAELSKLMPVFAPDRKVDAHWLALMDQVATRSGLKISKRQTEAEQQDGDVYELPIVCLDWEGSLDAIVRFLFDLQNEGAMLDVRYLVVEPKGKDVLKGRFTLYCAFTREKGAGGAGNK